MDISKERLKQICFDLLHWIDCEDDGDGVFSNMLYTLGITIEELKALDCLSLIALPETLVINVFDDIGYNEEKDNLDDAIRMYLSDEYATAPEDYKINKFDKISGDISISVKWQ